MFFRLILIESKRKATHEVYYRTRTFFYLPNQKFKNAMSWTFLTSKY